MRKAIRSWAWRWSAATLAVLLVSGIALGATTITHLTYQHHGDQYHAYLEQRAREFERLHPGVTVELIIGVHDKFDVMVAGGTPPDVFDLPDYGHLALEGMFVDVRPLLERDGMLSLYNPAILELMTAPDGGIYAMPFELGSTPAFYNRDLFKEAGLADPEQLGEGWTWDAVLEAGKRLTVDRNGDGVPEQFGVDRPWGALWRQAVHQAGGAFYDDRMRPTRSLWNSPEAVEGISFVAEIYRSGITPHHHVPDQTQFYFWTGRTAINLGDGPGIVGAYLADATFDWDFYLQPKGPAYRSAAVGAGGPHILSSTQNLPLVWEWVKFYAASVEGVTQFVQMTGRLPALVAVQPVYPDVAGIGDKAFHYIFEQTVQPNPYSYTLPLQLNPRRINLDPVWRGQQSPQEFLHNLHNQMTAIIAELYGSN